MKSSSIRRYLRAYKIYGRSSTTVTYAFASAIAPREAYDHKKISEALAKLKQDPENLSCVYCSKPAEGWDHLIPVTKDGKLFGPGHRISNLVRVATNARRGTRILSRGCRTGFPAAR